ncbi:hypothetical protein B566_EDAN004981 [Ephemera danica]|nr:hypothetical protein B566_EDAN004981 [Ephemera danica]
MNKLKHDSSGTFSFGKANWFWTNGWYNDASGMFEWGTSGVTFDRADVRWNNKEPGGGPWDMERVTVYVDAREIFSDDMTITNGVMCEAIA